MTKNMYWPGEINEKEQTRFKFQCENIDCETGRAKFYAVYDEPGPALIPSGMPCPFCEEHAHWCMDGFASTNVVGKAGSHENPHYTPQLAAAEHKWMQMQIDETKKAVQGEDQLEGTAASPYGKYNLNIDKALEEGVIKKANEEQAAERNRIIDDRAKKVAEQADEKITDEWQRKHIGRRHDG